MKFGIKLIVYVLMIFGFQIHGAGQQKQIVRVLDVSRKVHNVHRPRNIVFAKQAKQIVINRNQKKSARAIELAQALSQVEIEERLVSPSPQSIPKAKSVELDEEEHFCIICLEDIDDIACDVFKTGCCKKIICGNDLRKIEPDRQGNVKCPNCRQNPFPPEIIKRRQ